MSETRERTIKNVAPLLGQAILRTAAMAHSTHLGNDLYFYLRVNQMLINDLGEDFVMIELAKEGRDWEQLKTEMQRVEKLVIKAKAYYDMIEDKTFTKKDRELRNKTEFMRIVSKIPLIDNPILFLFIFLLRRTDLQRRTMPSDAFKILEHSGFRKIELSKPGDKSASSTAASTSSTTDNAAGSV